MLRDGTSGQSASRVTARENLRTALTVEDAHGAQDYAAEVAVDPTSTREEKAAAHDLMVRAMGITGRG
jgi:hypothetical protein